MNTVPSKNLHLTIVLKGFNFFAMCSTHAFLKLTYSSTVFQNPYFLPSLPFLAKSKEAEEKKDNL
jgi:hypothetical protein